MKYEGESIKIIKKHAKNLKNYFLQNEMLIFQSARSKNYFEKFAKNNLKNNYLFLKTNRFYFI